MFQRFHARFVLAALVLIGPAAAATPANALELWSGRNFVFSRPNFANWTQPQYSDHVSPTVWLTRKDTAGLFNIIEESDWSATSPAGTEWAAGDAVDRVTLTFQPWDAWCAGDPANVVGVNAVMHVIAEDLFVEIRLDAWSTDAAGAGYSYTRAMQPVTTFGRGTWGRIKSLYR
jgi:hypothetical protein